MKKFWHYLGETAIVFLGVFAAFWLNDLRERKLENQRKEEIYLTIYEGLDRFYNSGRIENENGFIQFFQQLENGLDSAIANGKLAPHQKLYGDYWNIEVISTIINSGVISEVDIETFKKVSRFHTIHGNFLEFIEHFNDYYADNITANYINGSDEFFENGDLKPKYTPIKDFPEGLVNWSTLLVDISYQLKEEIKENHLSKFEIPSND